MVEWFVDTYNNNRWFRLLAGVALCVSAGLLLWASGGFPPWAWRFLFQVLGQFSALWGAHGAAMLVPLLGLILLSLALFILWAVLLLSAVTMVQHWWRDYHARQHFSEDLHEAEQMAEQMVWQEVARQAQPVEKAAFQAQWQPEVERQPRTAPLMQQPEHAQTVPLMSQNEQTQQPYAVARASRPARAAVGGASVSTYTQSRPSVPPRPRPAATTGNLAPYREPLRLVPREPEPIVEPEPELDYETLFEIEHPLIETTQPRLLHSAPLEDVHTDTLQEEAHTEELESALRLVVGIGLDPGIARKHKPNEDNLFAIQAMRAGKHGPHPVGLFVVADGMGGHADGQEASKLAIQVISDAIVPALLQVEADEDSFANLLKEGVHRANLALYRRNRELPEMMGTTLTATLVVDDQAYIANVGDSRTYLYRPLEGLKQVTRDHSLVARMVEDGVITRDEIYTHPRRNQIYRCLGERATVEVDSFAIDLCPDDVLVLCSDGLWEMVRDAAIQDVIAASVAHPAQISSMLVQSALSRGGADNISVVVIGVVRPSEEQS
ncbi:MAG TPA: protein phosphatase 2C domain-containing protein [Ktedonobacteraceae bacterium]|jgi:serine/threonine protein phosphatase PrpC